MASESYKNIDPILLEDELEKNDDFPRNANEKKCSYCLILLKNIISYLKLFLAVNGLNEILTLKKNFIDIKKDINEKNINNPTKLPNYTELSNQFIIYLEDDQNEITILKITYIIIKMFWKDAILCCLSILSFSLTSYYNASLIESMIFSLNNSDDNNLSTYAVIFSCVKIFHFFIGRTITFTCMTLFNKIKACLINAFYQKILELNKVSLEKLNIGKLKNVISNNFSFLEIKIVNIFFLLSSPISMIYAIILLWSHLGIISLFAFLILGIIFGIQHFLNKANQNYIEEKNLYTDLRIQKTNEVIENMKIIKLYGWNAKMETIIDEVRKKELKANLIHNLFVMFDVALSNTSSSFNISIIYLFYYYFSGNSENAFSPWAIISVYQIIEYVRLFQFLMPSVGLKTLFETKILLSRFADIFSIKSENPLNSHMLIKPSVPNIKLQLSHFSASYIDEHDKENLIINNISFNFEDRKTYIINGKIGSGKSSLFYAVLGQLHKYQGNIFISKSISYAAQEPFLFSETIRNNILFFLPYDETHYRFVVETCCLDEDLQNLPEGDLTQIGDNGNKLSGGQKIRVSLARALYNKSEIFLFDDIFNGLDNSVARKIFENILKFLKQKCVIIITHNIDFANKVDCPLTLLNGQLIPGFIDIGEEKEEKQVINPQTNEKNFQVNKINEEKIVYKKENSDNIPKYDRVNFETYKKYFSLTNPFYLIFFVFIFFILSDILRFYLTSYLSFFSSEEDIYQGLNILLILAFIMLFFNFLKYLVFITFFNQCNQKLHQKILRSILNAHTVFFDINSTASIINVFSNDIGIFDSIFIYVMIDAFETIFNFLFSISIVCYLNYSFIIPSLILVPLFFWIIFVWKKTILGIKLLDLENKNPLYDFLEVTYKGITSINAYEKKKSLKDYFDIVIKNSAKSNLCYWECIRGMNLVTDFFSSLLNIIGLFCVINTDHSIKTFGQSLLYLMIFAFRMSMGISQIISADAMMVSASRCFNYCDIENEKSNIDFKEIKNDLLKKGEIKFNEIYMKYQLSKNYLFKNLNLTINPGEKFGIVGRTGSGKSSIFNILFKMYEIEKGSVTIDGQDISKFETSGFRKIFSVMPQYPFIFTGTIKENIDPLDEYLETHIMDILEEVGLKFYVQSLKNGIFTELNPSSNLLSVGQKQLLCLARAILKKSKILVLDEATSNIDLETEKMIQEKIKYFFSDSTVLTIAHRIQTIADYDRILVLDKGEIVEIGEPFILLTNEENRNEVTKKGILANFVLSLGEKKANEILEIARNKYYTKKFK